MVTARQVDPFPIGSWARAAAMVGIVVSADDDTVMVFDPGLRQMARVRRREAQSIPAGAVTVTVTVALPVPHGLEEPVLRRWVATLTDEVLRERAEDALSEAGVDAGAALPTAHLEVAPAEESICLCGARTPAPPGATLVCARCGRQAVGPPARP